MLKDHDQATRLFQEVLTDFALDQSSSADGDADLGDDSNVGATIGPYRLVRRLGEGGSGIVYEAEQKVPVHRKVALKILKLGIDKRRVISRFQAERQALELMEHSSRASGSPSTSPKMPSPSLRDSNSSNRSVPQSITPTRKASFTAT